MVYDWKADLRLPLLAAGCNAAAAAAVAAAAVPSRTELRAMAL
jgi:hypothetical protein